MTKADRDKDWAQHLPVEIITPQDLLSALETIVEQAKGHGLVPPLIRNCMRSTEPR